MFSNLLNLPEPVVAAIRNDPYNDGGSDISVTRLIAPIQAVELTRRHQESLVEDVSDRLWATYGQLMHGLLERAVRSNEAFSKRYMSEQRMFTEVNGWKVSGQLDLYDRETKTLYDYKFVGAYAVKMAKMEGKAEWEQQLNLLRYLLFCSHGIVAENIAICGMVRDYSEKVGKEGIAPIEIIPVTLWNMPSVKSFLEGRVLAFQMARNLPDEQLPECTDEERWLQLKTGIFNRCRRYCLAKDICHQNKKEITHAK